MKRRNARATPEQRPNDGSATLSPYPYVVAPALTCWAHSLNLVPMPRFLGAVDAGWSFVFTRPKVKCRTLHIMASHADKQPVYIIGIPRHHGCDVRFNADVHVQRERNVFISMGEA